MSKQLRLSASFGRRFEIIGRLGRGGAGMVLKAVQKDLKRRVALKLVDPDLFDDRVMMERFAQEARVTAELQSPYVLTVFEAGVDEGPDGEVPYIVYEMIEGSDLGTLLEKAGGKLEPDRALAIMSDVLEGLAVAHEHEPQVLHRDIKPDNILISKEGVVKIADFGIAKRQGSGPRTQTGMVVGTPTYMSPEQAQGLPLGHRSDLYSTACMVYECLVGRPPFVAGSGMEVAVMHVRDPAPPASRFDPAIPPEVDAILAQGLHKEADMRFEDAREFKEALAGARRSWTIWVNRAAEGPARPPPATPSLVSGGASSSATGVDRRAVTEGMADPSRGSDRPARGAQQAVVAPAVTRAMGPESFRSAPVRAAHLSQERKMLLGIGCVLALAILAVLHMTGLLGRATPTTPLEQYAPLQPPWLEVGCLAANLHWESERAYPSRVVFRRRNDAAPPRQPERVPDTPVRQHEVDLDDLTPGTEYEYVILYPDGKRSLPYHFTTKQLKFHQYPVGKLEQGGKLRVRWSTNRPARGVILARIRGARGAGERERVDLRSYETDVDAEVPGFSLEDDVEFKVLLFTRWWDDQLARGLESRIGPVVFTPYYQVRSMVSIAREKKNRLAEALRALAVPRTLPWPSPGDPRHVQEVERLLGKLDESEYFDAHQQFEGSVATYFESGEVDWGERHSWYQDVCAFHDWVQGLAAQGIMGVASLGVEGLDTRDDPFRVSTLYFPGLGPLGERSRVKESGPWARSFELRYQDRQDPDFEPVLGTEERPVLVTEFTREGAEEWPEAEVALRVQDLTAGTVIWMDLPDGTRLRFRGSHKTAVAEEPVWLFHQLPPQALSPAPLFATMGMYTAPGAAPSKRHPRIEEVRVWGRLR